MSGEYEKTRPGWFVRFIRIVLCRPPARCHTNFVSLGYNCELAFRYNSVNGFVDSGLFQWSFAYSLDDLIAVLENLDRLYTGEVKDPNPLYECANTRIRQHGKAPMSLWLNGVAEADRAKMEADKADLVGRMKHLKEKFAVTLRDGGALVMYKIRSAEVMAGDAPGKVSRLIAALDRLGARDYDFVLVCEECCRGRIELDESRQRFVRFVRAFNPDDAVTDEKLGDRCGWRRLHAEFRPATRKQKKHKFKFEK